MSITRRKVLAGSAVGAASLASGLAAPAIAANEPIQIGYLPALTGPSSSTGVGINRGTVLAVNEINAAGGVDGRKIELIVRDTQSDPTKAVNAVAELTQRQKVAPHLGPAELGRGAGGHAADRARRGAADASLLGRLADRREEIPDGLPQRADQPADRRRGQPLRRGRAEAQEGGGDQRHDRLRHGVGRGLCADAEDQGRRGGVLGPRRRDQSRPQARAAAHARRGRAGHHAVERQCRLPGAHPQHARRRWAGTCRWSARRPWAPARPRRCWRSRNTGTRSTPTTSATSASSKDGKLPARAQRIRGEARQGQDRDGRHAAVVDRAGLRRPAPDGRDLQGRRHRTRPDRRLPGTSSRAGRASTATSPSRRSCTTASPTTRSCSARSIR